MDSIKSIIQQSIDVKSSLLQNEQMVALIEAVSTTITQQLKAGHKILFCGNGGSAADAQHLAAEFSGRFYKDRHALPAEALHCNTSYLTAVANDYSYDVVYSRLVQGIGHSGDVLIALSTSGNSTNIIEAIKTANQKEMITIGFTGQSGGQMKSICKHLFNVASTTTPRIQEAHMLIGHIICQLVEEKYFPNT